LPQMAQSTGSRVAHCARSRRQAGVLPAAVSALAMVLGVSLSGVAWVWGHGCGLALMVAVSCADGQLSRPGMPQPPLPCRVSGGCGVWGQAGSTSLITVGSGPW
jgi:hypothetical protein